MAVFSLASSLIAGGTSVSTTFGTRRSHKQGASGRRQDHRQFCAGRLACKLQRNTALYSAAPAFQSSMRDRETARLLRATRREQDEGLTEVSPPDGQEQPRGNAPIDWANTSLLFLFPAMCGLLFGYDIGATSGALVSLKSSATSGTEWGPALTSIQSGTIVSASLAGALAASTATFFLGNKIGRKAELQLAALLYGGSAIAMATAPSLPVLIAAHTTYGLGIGFAMHAAPAYIAETAPVSVRGLLISLKECFIVGGILLGYLSGNSFIDADGGWRLMLSCAAPVAAGAFLGLLTLPESPRWLLLSSVPEKEARAKDALARCLGGKAAASSKEVAAELEMIKGALGKDAAASALNDSPLEKLGQLIANPSYRQPLLIGTSLMFFQQVTGQPSVLYYAAEIFKEAGFEAASDATRVSVLLGFFKLVVTGVATVKVDSWGRRPLLLAGVAGMVASLTLLSSASLGFAGDSSAYVSAAALLFYVGCYQLSFGPISWLIVGEVFPLAVRGQALALATVTNFGANFAVSLFLPYAEESFGLGGLYLLFAGVGVLALANIFLNIPETRGKTLEEIEAMWEGGRIGTSATDKVP